MTLNLATLLRQGARRHPDRPALVFGAHTIAYAALDEMARKFAAGLRSMGITPGQHIALLLPNVPQFTIAYFGAHYAGAVIVPLNVLLTADEIAYHLDDAEAVALVTFEGFIDQATAGFARVAGCHHLIVARAPGATAPLPAGARDMAAVLEAAPPVTDLQATMPDDIAVILYTSGTTGRPKGAELTHFNLFYNAEFTATRLLPPDPHRVALGALPMFHSFGQTVVQNATMVVGGTVVLLPRFEPKAAFEAIERHRVTLFAGVPTMYFALLNHPDAASHDVGSLRHCMSGGAPMPVEVMKAFDERYRVNILEGYGLSETSPVASFNVLDQPKKAGSIGIPIAGVEFQLLDAAGAIVDRSGVPGEIIIKGVNVMKGYHRRPEATAEAVVDGWFRTGDVATRDDDGYYFIVDRKKDMLIRGGYNVYPREIEEILYGHPAVLEAAVLGVPHASHGEEVKAVLALKPGQSVTAEEITDYCKERLAAYKYPRIVEFMASLPKGPTGKILKRELRGKLGCCGGRVVLCRSGCVVASGALPCGALSPGAPVGGVAPCGSAGALPPAPPAGRCPCTPAKREGACRPFSLGNLSSGLCDHARRACRATRSMGASCSRVCMTACAPVAAHACARDDAVGARGSAGSQRCTNVHT
jgi:long-chain acyl-CoA synthetase